MPPCDYKEYHPEWKSRIVPDIIKRAGNCCEWCGITNKAVIKRLKNGNIRMLCQTEWDMIYSRIKYSLSNMVESLKYHGFSKIVLTVAHIDHDKNNNDYSNLAALCQRCHLKHDIKNHAANRKYGRKHKGEQQFKLL